MPAFPLQASWCVLDSPWAQSASQENCRSCVEMQNGRFHPRSLLTLNLHFADFILYSRTVIESGQLPVFLDGMCAPEHNWPMHMGEGTTSQGLLEHSLSFLPLFYLSLYFFLPPSPILPSLSLSHSFSLTCIDFIFLFFSGNTEIIEPCFCFSPSLGADPFHLWFSQFPSKLNIKQICLLTADPRSGRAHGPAPGGGGLSRQR